MLARRRQPQLLTAVDTPALGCHRVPASADCLPPQCTCLRRLPAPQCTCLRRLPASAVYLPPLTWHACLWCLIRQVTLGPGAYSIEETAYWSERVYR